MIFIYIAMVLLVAVLVKQSVNELNSRRKYAMSAKATKELSWPAKQILAEYNRLPAEHRPYANLNDMLDALDVKHIKDEVNNHFGGRDGYPDWDCRCRRYRGGCLLYPEYVNLYSGIQSIAQALESQEHALEVERVRGRLDAVKELTERLRQERELIDSVTKELTE